MTSEYKLVRSNNHPKASPVGQVSEHVLVAERALGKYLPPKAVIHHVNGNKRDNRPENLVICQDTAYHSLLHRRLRAVRAGGDPNTQTVCGTCKRLVAISDINGLNRHGNLGSQCKSCRRAYNIAYINRVCEWTMADEDTGLYETTCGQAFVLTEGTPTENSFKFCCYCGKKLKEKR